MKTFLTILLWVLRIAIVVFERVIEGMHDAHRVVDNYLFRLQQK